jgi:hypothetical protein
MMKRKQGGLILFLYLLAGGIIGSVVGEALGSVIPLMQKGITLGLMPPAELNLWFIHFVFGFRFNLNLAGALGMILAFVAYRR